MHRTAKEVAAHVQARVEGDPSVGLSGIGSIASAGDGDVVFVEDEKNFRSAMESQATAVIAGKFAAGKAGKKTLLICAQPRLAFARAARFLNRVTEHVSGVHPSAVVDSTAKLGAGVAVGERVVIGKHAEVGARTRIGAGAVIGAEVRIGAECEIYPNVTIYAKVRIGDRVMVHAGAVLGSDGFGYVRDDATGRYEKFPQIGMLEIGDDVEIGANATIDRGALDVTRIERGTKIDNLVHVGHNCRIGEDVIIAAQTGLSGSISIEKHAVLGGQVGIGEHARIQEGVMLGGQSGVLPNKILRGKGVAFWGTPAKPLREYLKELAALAKLSKKE